MAKVLRELLEEQERLIYSERAAFSSKTRGRLRQEKPCNVRTEFQRDRDRIIHSKAFRRLMRKTQVFISPEGDHYRTRLTHAIEVSQIARTISRGLRLNEDLTEAIALGHDLGHTPFGHIGELALTECLEKIKSKNPGLKVPFKHNEQSLRVVDIIERKGDGLNLTYEVRDGILKHTGDELPTTLEGQIVKIADRIAYVNHDIDDAIRGNVITLEELPSRALKVLGYEHSKRIDTTVKDIIKISEDGDLIKMSKEVSHALNLLRDYLFEAVYLNPDAKSEDKKAKEVITLLFFYYYDNSQELPVEFQPQEEKEIPVRVCDYIAGMTDRYALKKFEEIFVPQSWMV